MNLDHPRIIDVQNYRYHFPTFSCSFPLTVVFVLTAGASLFNFGGSVFVATWNVAGRSPPSNLNLDDWLHAAPPADIYVLGYVLVAYISATFTEEKLKSRILMYSDELLASQISRNRSIECR